MDVDLIFKIAAVGILEEKIFALPSLPNRMARLSKTHRPSTVTGAGQLVYACSVTA